MYRPEENIVTAESPRAVVQERELALEAPVGDSTGLSVTGSPPRHFPDGEIVRTPSTIETLGSSLAPRILT